MRNKSRLATIFGSVIAALALGIAIPGSAQAASCSGYQCDGHNPNIQTWQSGPVTPYDIDLGSSNHLELRWGKTDGDQYGWARLEYSSIPPAYNITVERCNKGGGSCETGLGKKAAGASGWTVKKAGTSNTYTTWTPMYYNPSTKQVRACVTPTAGGTKRCTAWY
ncbi:hypothetical protein [Streptomyces sp. NBC_00893]|uniref:hypothetical protein n=1 Tax=Streptomyces sp. NBC_00893 TaxID=2975862 RepID=UPI002259B591|nr:hypothetical protein [Streptomyces sp. NBC_00893]MCX4847069.1 hypothetical protein [Streptomyces sp. NBC_00893]